MPTNCSGSTTDIEIKHVPADVYQVLHTRAAAEGTSLQHYLLKTLFRYARPTVDEMLPQIREDAQRLRDEAVPNEGDAW